MGDRTPRQVAIEALIEARLATIQVTAEDGYPAFKVRSDEEAATVALTALARSDDLRASLLALVDADRGEPTREWRVPNGFIARECHCGCWWSRSRMNVCTRHDAMADAIDAVLDALGGEA